MTAPTDYARRSFVYRKLAHDRARFAEVAGGAIAIACGGGDEAAIAGRLGLADLSLLPRTGFKGKNALPALEGRGLALAGEPNRAFRQTDGGLAAVLAMTEVLILAPISGDGTQIRTLESSWSIDAADGCYLVPRQDSHFWFALTGAQAGAMFAKICGVDLRLDRFADLSIAQTSVARSNCVVIRADLGALPAFHLLGDSASAEYMWDCLLDAITEFSGRPVGLAALQKAARDAEPRPPVDFG
jgi:sarcosine oxidase, subunit gamma